MATTPTGNVTTVLVALVAVVLGAGIALYALGDRGAADGLVGVAVGIVTGGGGVHLARRSSSS